jgi:hypothetical protein
MEPSSARSSSEPTPPSTLPFDPLLVLLLLAIAGVLWFPTLQALGHWRPFRTAEVGGRRIALPFLWQSDGQLSPTLTRPPVSILNRESSTLTLSVFSRGGDRPVAVDRGYWLYQHGFTEERPAGNDTFPPIQSVDRSLMPMIGTMVRYDLSPYWRCAEESEPRAEKLRIECLARDSQYELKYLGRAAYVSDVRTIAEDLDSGSAN